MNEIDLEKVRERHRQFKSGNEGCVGCLRDLQNPCDAIQLVNEVERLKHEAEIRQSDITRFHKHRDAWRRYAYGKRERPGDFLDMKPCVGPTKIDRLKEDNAHLREALGELVECASLRGDNDLPHPADDPLLWTARMQEAWNNADALLKEPSDEGEASERG